MNPESSASVSLKNVSGYLFFIMRPLLGVFVLALIGNVLYSAIDAAIIRLIKPLIDDGLVAQDQAFLNYIPWALPLIFALRGMMSFLSGYGMSWVSRHVVVILRQNIFDKILKLPASFFDDSHSSELIARLIYNVEQIAKASTDTITDFFREGCLVIFIIGVMLSINVHLTILFILVVPPIIFCLIWMSRRFRKTSHQIQKAIADVTHVGQEAIESYREIRLFSGEAFEASRFHAVAEHHRDREMKLVLTKEISIPFIQFLCASAFAWTLHQAISGLGHSHLSAGDFTALITAIITLFKPVKQLSALNATLQQGLAAAQGIFYLLSTPDEPDQGNRALEKAKGEIEYNQVSFQYQSEQPILKAVSFKVSPGQVVAFVGRSGSGKTTLVNLLPRFYPAYSGQIKLDGIDIQSLKLADLRNQIALVSQNIILFNDSILHNVAYAHSGKPDIKRAQAALQAANLEDLISKLPNGIYTPVGENGVLFSGGQRQRLALARAIYKDAPILILDEATASLDAESERAIQGALQCLMRGRTTLVIAHRLSTIESADLILVLDQGTVVESGTHSELLNKQGLYRNLYDLQKNA